jgi:hypothetical protein
MAIEIWKCLTCGDEQEFQGKKAFIEHLKTAHRLTEPIQGKGERRLMADGQKGYWEHWNSWQIEPDIEALQIIKAREKP